MKLRALFVVVLTMVCGMVTVNEATATQPHIQRSGTNLVTNPDLNGNANGWALTGTVYDGTVSRDAGTGSLKSTAINNAINSGYLAVTPGNTYTLSFYMRSSIFPR